MTVGNNYNLGNINIGTTKKNDKAEFTKLVAEVSKDGIVTPQEREKVFTAGYKIKDQSKFEELKQGISTDFPDIAAAFDEGHTAGTKSDSLDKEIKTIGGKHLESTLRKQAVSEEGFFRRMAGSVKEGVDVVKSGLKSDKNDSSILGSFAESVSNVLGDASLSDDKEAKIKNQVKNQTNEMAQNNSAKFVTNKVNTVKKDYQVNAADLVNCVKHSLDTMGYARNTKLSKTADDVNEPSLEKMTGKKWDGFDFSKTSTDNAKTYLKGQEGKALITDGGHAYVFKGMTKEGNLSVFDATVNEMKVISKNNSAVTVFVQGKADGNKTSIAKGEIKSFKNVDSLSNINNVDKTNGKLNESWDIRKSLIMMGDPKEAQTVKDIAQAVKSKDVGKLKEIFAAKGIKFSDKDDRELKAMITVLNEKITVAPGVKTTMMDRFLTLNKTEGVKQNNYMKAVEYTNLDLTDYFSSVDNSQAKAQDMNDVFNQIMAGKKGC